MASGSENEPGWDAFFAHQVSQNGRLFFRLANGVLGDRAAAQDVCQQALLKAWEKRGTLKKVGKIRNWLARVVVNESLQVLRRGKIESDALASQGAIDSATVGRSRESHSDLRESVLLALERLPEDVRIVVVMRCLEGMSGNEVKNELGCSASEVSRQLHQGLELLRAPLGVWREYNGDGEEKNNVL